MWKKKNYILVVLSKQNSNCEKQVILLIVSNGQKHKAESKGRLWYYFAVKKLSPLLR